MSKGRPRPDALPPGVLAGHFTDLVRVTGCTVFLFDPGASAALHRFGPATATRHLDPLDVVGVERPIHGLVFTGGSAFGLACPNGAMQVLRERGLGVATRGGLVPRVPAAVIHDLTIGDQDAWPSAADAERAARAACGALPAEGSVGVGTGATIGKALGPAHATKGGVGYAAAWLEDVFVGVFVVVNAFGDVVDKTDGRILAGCHDLVEGTPRWLGPGVYHGLGFGGPGCDAFDPAAEESTSLALVITDAAFTQRELGYVAQVASQAYARTISPAGTVFDGDLVFAVSVGQRRADLLRVAYGAACLLEDAIARSIDQATGLAGIPARRDFGSA